MQTRIELWTGRGARRQVCSQVPVIIFLTFPHFSAVRARLMAEKAAEMENNKME